MGTASREERMRALTGDVPADVAGVVVLCQRLAGAVADVQETLGRIEARQVTMDARAEELLAGLERGNATRHGDLQTAVGSLVHTLDVFAVRLGGTDETLAALEAKLDALTQRLASPVYVADNDLAPVPPGWIAPEPAEYTPPAPVVPEPEPVAEPAPAATLDDLADLLDPNLNVLGTPPDPMEPQVPGPDVAGAPVDDGSAS